MSPTKYLLLTSETYGSGVLHGKRDGIMLDYPGHYLNGPHVSIRVFVRRRQKKRVKERVEMIEEEAGEIGLMA